MPVISRFFGISIYMYWRDHAPPHFHAKYQGGEVVINIETGEVQGAISRRALALIEDWRILHTAELMENWKLASDRKLLKQILPLE